MAATPKAIWDNNYTQFARLIDELAAAGAPNRAQMKLLRESMGLDKEDIENIFDRAAIEWQRAKSGNAVRISTPDREVENWNEHA